MPEHIAVIGLGQIGGSIVHALRKHQYQGMITGIDTSAKRLRLLSKYLDVHSTTPKDAESSDLTIVALHYTPLQNFLNDVAFPDSILMDVCSAKRSVLSLANRRKLRFIGGHPLAGNEFAVEKGWREDLFENAPFFLCPGSASTKSDLAVVKQMVRMIGAIPAIVNPVIHDRYLAATSHFPAFLSRLLKDTSTNVPGEFQGPGFRSMTRLAGTSPDLLDTFMQSNCIEILKCARKFHRELGKWIESHSLEGCAP